LHDARQLGEYGRYLARRVATCCRFLVGRFPYVKKFVTPAWLFGGHRCVMQEDDTDRHFTSDQDTSLADGSAKFCQAVIISHSTIAKYLYVLLCDDDL
jgi:hypothetical protein